MNLHWQPQALDDLDAIADYISNDNLVAAFKLTAEIAHAVKALLPDHPHIGRPGRIGGTRELLVHRNYIVVYRVGENVIDIVSVRHAARLWPEQF